MKKIIVMLLCIATLSLITTACGKDNPPTQSASSKQTQAENSTSTSGKVSRVFGSSASLPDISKAESTTASDNNSSSSTPEIVGETVYIPSDTPVPDGASTNVAMTILQINLIESVGPSNYQEKYEYVLSAEQLYSELTPAEQAQVANYNHLLTAKEACLKLISAMNIKNFLSDYEKLCAITTLSSADVELIATLRSTYSSFSQSELEQLGNFAEIKAKIDESYNSLKAQGLMEFSVCIDNLSSLSESTFFQFSSGIVVEETSNGDKLQFNGTYPTRGAKLVQGESITFTTSVAGTLVVYAYRTDALTLSQGSTPIAETVDSSFGDDFSTRTFNVSTAGTYTLSLLEGEVFILAISLSA